MTEDNKRRLEQNGYAPTFANLHLLHVAGPNRGMAVLRASDEQPIATVLRADALNSNKEIFQGKTVGEVKSWAGSARDLDRRPAGSRLAPPLWAPSPPAVGLRVPVENGWPRLPLDYLSPALRRHNK